MGLVLVEILYYSHNSVGHCSQLDVNNNNCFVCYSSVYSLCINYNNCLTDLSNEDLQTTITLFKRTAFLYKTEWTSLVYSFALSCLLFGIVTSLMNVLEGEGSWLRILEISINANIVVSLLSFAYFVYIYTCSVVCGFLFTCLP